MEGKNNIVYIAGPKLKINYTCSKCNNRNKSTNPSINVICTSCNKKSAITKEGYSIDITGFYLPIILGKLIEHDDVKLRFTDSYRAISETLLYLLNPLGLKIVSRERIVDENKNSHREIEVNEITLKKIGAIM